MLRQGTVVVLAAAVALWLAGTVCAQVAVGQKAPEIKAQKWFNTNGELSLAQLQGKIVVVEFWATWCPPCQRSIPHLNALHNKYKDKGVVILGLSDENADKVESFIKRMNAGEKKQMEYPVAAGSNDGRAYGVRGIPHAFLVTSDGKVAWAGHPMAGLDEAIEKALKDSPPVTEKK